MRHHWGHYGNHTKIIWQSFGNIRNHEKSVDNPMKIIEILGNHVTITSKSTNSFEIMRQSSEHQGTHENHVAIMWKSTKSFEIRRQSLENQGNHKESNDNPLENFGSHMKSCCNSCEFMEVIRNTMTIIGKSWKSYEIRWQAWNP